MTLDGMTYGGKRTLFVWHTTTISMHPWSSDGHLAGGKAPTNNLIVGGHSTEDELPRIAGQLATFGKRRYLFKRRPTNARGNWAKVSPRNI